MIFFSQNERCRRNEMTERGIKVTDQKNENEIHIILLFLGEMLLN